MEDEYPFDCGLIPWVSSKEVKMVVCNANLVYEHHPRISVRSELLLDRFSLVWCCSVWHHACSLGSVLDHFVPVERCRLVLWIPQASH